MKYFEIVAGVLDQVIPAYAGARGLAVPDVDRLIAQHIQHTSNEHYSAADPNINYDEPLCRLGYLFMHAAANAYLFERALRLDMAAQQVVAARAGEPDHEDRWLTGHDV